MLNENEPEIKDYQTGQFVAEGPEQPKFKLWVTPLNRDSEEVNEIIALLLGFGVNRAEVQLYEEVNETRALLQSYFLNNPVLTVVTGDLILGDLSRLRSMSAEDLRRYIAPMGSNENAQSPLNTNDTTKTNTAESGMPSLGITDRLVEVAKLAGSYLNPYSYYQSRYEIIGNEEYDVICENQIRKYIRRFCFYDLFFIRMTTEREIKAQVNYSHVIRIQWAPNGDSMKLTYDTSREELQSHSTDTLTAAKPVLQRIAQLLHSKNPKVEIITQS